MTDFDRHCLERTAAHLEECAKILRNLASIDKPSPATATEPWSDPWDVFALNSGRRLMRDRFRPMRSSATGRNSALLTYAARAALDFLMGPFVSVPFDEGVGALTKLIEEFDPLSFDWSKARLTGKTAKAFPELLEAYRATAREIKEAFAEEE